jgi:hypothetical protein
VRELGADAGDDPDDDPDDAGDDLDDDRPVGPGSPARVVTLGKDLGETFVVGQGLLSTPPWAWGTRR